MRPMRPVGCLNRRDIPLQQADRLGGFRVHNSPASRSGCGRYSWVILFISQVGCSGKCGNVLCSHLGLEPLALFMERRIRRVLLLWLRCAGNGCCFIQPSYLSTTQLGQASFPPPLSLVCPWASRLFELERYLYGVALGGFRQIIHNCPTRMRFVAHGPVGCLNRRDMFMERRSVVSGT